jgi:hypothetical protein
MGQATRNPPLETSNAAAAPILDAVAAVDWSTLDWSHEVRVNQRSAFDRLSVKTENHWYEVLVVDGEAGDVLVRGGKFFPVFTAARLIGSSLGGSMVRLRCINPGFQIEFAIKGGRSVITSPVQNVAVIARRTSRHPDCVHERCTSGDVAREDGHGESN